jgi:hypothetical protein
MDHLPRPADSLRDIEVPLLDIIPYDFKGLAGFPFRAGYNEEDLKNPNTDPQLVATVLQSWLYFGVISEVLQTPINPDDFALHSKNLGLPRQLTVVPLLRLFPEVTALPSPLSTDDRRYDVVVAEACPLLRDFEIATEQIRQDQTILQVTLSIRMMYYLICGHYAHNRFHRRLLCHPLLSQRFEERGWCPSHIRRIETHKSDLIEYYLSSLPRPNPRGFSHSSCFTTHCVATNTKLATGYVTQHTHKSSIKCNLVRIDETKVRNIISDGRIPLVSIHLDPSGTVELKVHAAASGHQYVAISHVWADGLGNPTSNSLPECQLRRLSGYLSSLPNPSARAYSDNSRAMWGFGPLSFDLRTFRPGYLPPGAPLLFWMDTLCIPVANSKDDTQAGELKKRAIDQMAAVYKDASHVLVLDSSLQELRIAVTQRCELLAHIIFSNWMGRSWTLQEGALNRYVYFQFADGAINILDVLPKPDRLQTQIAIHPARFRRVSVYETLRAVKWAWDHKKSNQHRSQLELSITDTLEKKIYKTLYTWCTEALHNSGYRYSSNFTISRYSKTLISRSDSEWVQKLVSVWNALALRTTTMEEDLPAIFANMLGIEASTVLALPTEQRLRAMLGAGSILPLSILYNRGPRLRPTETHMGRWIPTFPSRDPLAEVPTLRFDQAQNLLLRSDDIALGLRPEFLLPMGPATLDKEFVLTDGDGNRWFIKLEREEHDEFDTETYNYPAFIISHDETSVQACCIRILRTKSPFDFEAIYDSPCIALKKLESHCDATPNIEVRRMIDWNITILSPPIEHTARIIPEDSPWFEFEWVAPKLLGRIFDGIV